MVRHRARTPANLVVIAAITAVSFQVSALADPAASPTESQSPMRVVPIDLNASVAHDTPLPTQPGKPASIGGTEVSFAKGEQFKAGIWDGTRGFVSVNGYPVDEVWHVLKGSITFTNTAGEAQTFKQGETFVVPKGFKGTAEMHEDFRKLFVSYASAE